MKKLSMFVLAAIFLLPCDIAATKLHNACYNGKLEVVKELISNSANVNAKNEFGDTPLHYASVNDHEEVVTFLLNNNADLNAKNIPLNTPLHIAAEKGYETIVNIFCNNQANVNAKDSPGDTPLHRAAYKGHKEVAKLLLNNGADVSDKNNWSETPLHKAAYEGHEEIAKLLLINNGIDLGIGHTPLHTAASNGREGFIKQLTAAPLLLRQSNNSNSQLSKQAHNELNVYCANYARKLFDSMKNLPVPAVESVRSIINYILPIKDDIESHYIKAFLRSCYQNLKDNSQQGQPAFTNLFIHELHNNHLSELKLYIAIKSHDKQTAIERAIDCNHNNIVEYLTAIENAQSYNALDEDLRAQTEKNYQLAVGYKNCLASC